MSYINKLYAFIHQDYNRLGFLEDEERLWYLTPESYGRYVRARQNQQEIINKVANDKQTALLVVPYSLDFFDRWYHHLSTRSRDVLETHLQDIACWANTLGDRFALLKSGDFENETVSRRNLFQKETIFELRLKDFKFQEKLPFSYSPKTAELNVFGEYTSHCVKDYGTALRRALGISEDRFQIIDEASLENIHLLHEHEDYFYMNLPGWGNERR